MKLTTWNVNGIRSVLTKGALQTYLETAQPDIICFQETKAQMDQVTEDFRQYGYEAYWNSAVRKGYSGTLMLTKESPKEVTKGIGIEEHDQEGRVITAEFSQFYLVTVYTPNAKRDLSRLAYRERWEDDFCEYLTQLSKKKAVLVCGDLNVAPTAIDLANPKTNVNNAGFTQEERNKFAQLQTAGFKDVFRYLYPHQEGAYTWWSYMGKARERNVGWRIDHWLATETLLPLVQDVVIRHDILGSDHCPVELVLK